MQRIIGWMYSVPALQPNYTPFGGVLFFLAHLFGGYFEYFEGRKPKQGLKKRAGNPTARAFGLSVSSRQPLHVTRRCTECLERTEPMLPPNKTRDLARILVASEADASTTSLHPEPATVRVYERLRRQLASPVGIDGFQALASRALALAKAESPWLSSVEVTANGDLRGLDKVESRRGTGEDRESGINLIAHLLGLFLTFLGEATTLRLIEDLRLQVDAGTEPVNTGVDKTASAADSRAMAPIFEDLLREIDRLRSVSAHIEILADKHPGMEDGLVSVAGNIRSIATVLDVFTLIRSKAGGSQEDGPNPEANRYMN